MMRRLSSFAAVALLAISACGGGASPAPATSGPSAAAATPTTAPVTPAPTPLPASTPAATETVTTSIADVAGSSVILAEIPAGWITITAGDIADEASFSAWLAAHPEIPSDVASTVAQDMSTGGVSLFAFDAQNAVDGFTPNLNTIWVDAPVRDFEPWVAEQASQITSQYGLATPLEYQAWAPEGDGAVGGFIGAYRYSMSGVALAGSQMIVPMPDGRAAVLTFTCREGQTDLFGPIVEAIFTSLSERS